MKNRDRYPALSTTTLAQASEIYSTQRVLTLITEPIPEGVSQFGFGCAEDEVVIFESIITNDVVQVTNRFNGIFDPAGDLQRYRVRVEGVEYDFRDTIASRRREEIEEKIKATASHLIEKAFRNLDE